MKDGEATVETGPLAQVRADRVLTLTFDAAPAHALSSGMLVALQTALDAAAADPDVNVIVLASSGPIFCAGHDLREMRSFSGDDDGGRSRMDALFARCAGVMTSIVHSPKPVIAKVDGIATAAGCQLVAACDLAYASDRAGFCTPGVNLGGFCVTPMVALSRAIGRKAAMEMLLSGDTIDAETARQIGLVNRVLPAEDLDGFVDDFAARLATRNPGPIADGKGAFQTQLDLPLEQAYAHASRIMVDQFRDPGTAESIDAFLEKRRPRSAQD